MCSVLTGTSGTRSSFREQTIRFYKERGIMAYFLRYVCAALLVILMFSAPAFSSPVRKIEKMFHGVASFYADKFNGKKTASGDVFDNSKLTCAHRTLPFGTKILVKNPDTGSCCEVIVNDRGPYAHNRVVDLSKAAARKLGITGLGKVVCYAGKTVVNAIDVDGPIKTSKTTVANGATNGVIASAVTTQGADKAGPPAASVVAVHPGAVENSKVAAD
ncbi:MAG: septal ring lytic transglycosylase RlpA family protein [Cyanobacteria bacterium SZAS-4]|nr:septal ring lytic transglycosylase RlpA family protein [Cyanobacteria bacterium SZAS-4]